MGTLLDLIGILRRGENRSTRRKTSRSKERTSNKLNPHMSPGPRIEPGRHWWETSALITTPPLLPLLPLLPDFCSKAMRPNVSHAVLLNPFTFPENHSKAASFTALDQRFILLDAITLTSILVKSVSFFFDGFSSDISNTRKSIL